MTGTWGRARELRTTKGSSSSSSEGALGMISRDWDRAASSSFRRSQTFTAADLCGFWSELGDFLEGEGGPVGCWTWLGERMDCAFLARSA